NGWIVGLAIAIPAAVVLIRGINSLSNATSCLVPVMSLVYAVAAFVVLGFNFSEIPYAFVQIFQGAFTTEVIYVGMLGMANIVIQRALFSYVAGVGTAALAHGVTKNRRPAEEGLVAAWEPFLDSVIVCTLTAIAIIVTGEHLNAGADGITLAT